MTFDLSTPGWNLFYGQFFFTRKEVSPGSDWIALSYGACTLDLIEARLRYPKQAIRQTTITVEAINYIWPELSELPYNQYGGDREVGHWIKRRIKNYRRRKFKK